MPNPRFLGRGAQAHEVHPAGQSLAQLPLLGRVSHTAEDEVVPGELRLHTRGDPGVFGGSAAAAFTLRQPAARR
jgi:hypothetical protein